MYAVVFLCFCLFLSVNYENIGQIVSDVEINLRVQEALVLSGGVPPDSA